MLTTDEIAKVMANPGRKGTKGIIAALQRKNQQGMRNNLSMNQRYFLADVQKQPVQAMAANYNHPADQLQPPAREEPLSAAQVAWLTTRPADPAAVSYADAQEVFRLAQSAKGMQHRGDAPLIRSVADPLREFHDRNKAQAELAAAQQPLAPNPASALGALADAVAAEHEDLQPDEAITRASNMIQEIAQKRIAERSAKITAVQQRLADIDKAAADRVAVTR